MPGSEWVDLQDLRGGRNGQDPPLSLAPDQVNEAVNVEYTKGALARKRNGSVLLPLTGDTVPVGTLWALFRFVPGDNEGAAELFSIDGTNGRFRRMAGGTLWAHVPAVDGLNAKVHDANAVAFNKKLFIAYSCSLNRFHCYDPLTGTIRRVGLAPAAAAPPTNALVAGAVTDTRKYRVRMVVWNGAVVTRRSEPSPVTDAIVLAGQYFTSGSVAGPGDGETHMEVEASSILSNYTTWHRIWDAPAVSPAGGFYDNNPLLSDFPIITTLAGTHNVPPSAKFVISDDARVIMAGAWIEHDASPGHTACRFNRVWWTPVQGDLDIGDDERVPSTSLQKNYLDVTDAITGLGGPILGSFYVFSYRKFWRFSPTGLVRSPYRRTQQGFGIGAIHGQAVTMGEDESGNQCLYFGSRRGVYRIGTSGLEFCGWDVQDVWDTINFNAVVPVSMVFHTDKHQLWVNIVTTGGGDFPNQRLVLDTKRTQRDPHKGVVKGWTRYTGDSTVTAATVMFSRTPGNPMSKGLVPYSSSPYAATVHICDREDSLTDSGTAYEAYIVKSVAPSKGTKFGIGGSYVFADAAPGVTIREIIAPDFGASPGKSSDVDLTPAGAETKIFTEFQDGHLAGMDFSATLRLGDITAIANRWTLDRWRIELHPEESL